MNQEMQQTIDRFIFSLKATLKQWGEIPPMVYFVYELVNGSYIVFPFDTSVELITKKASNRTLRNAVILGDIIVRNQLITIKKLSAVLVASVAYFTKHESTKTTKEDALKEYLDSDKPLPSKDPDRAEVFMVITSLPDKDIFHIEKMQLKNDVYQFSESNDFKGFEENFTGRFSRLYPL